MGIPRITFSNGFISKAIKYLEKHSEGVLLLGLDASGTSADMQRRV